MLGNEDNGLSSLALEQELVKETNPITHLIFFCFNQMLGRKGCRILSLSVLMATLLQASVAHNHKLIVDWVSVEDLEDDTLKECSKTHMGGTMCLGSRRTYFQVVDCKYAKLYGNVIFVDERHWHRYEVNSDKISQLESVGLSFVGKDETGRRIEIVELPGHPFFVGAQLHLVFKSRPGKPSPLFSGLIAAVCKMSRTVLPASNGHAKLTNGIHNRHLSVKAHNGNGSLSPNGSINGVHKKLHLGHYLGEETPMDTCSSYR